MSAFREWLAHEMTRRGWSHSELSRQANISRPLISQVLAGDVAPSADFCIKVAVALQESPVLVLVKAELLPSGNESGDDSTVQELLEMIRSLPADQRQNLLNYVRFLYQTRPD